MFIIGIILVILIILFFITDKTKIEIKEDIIDIRDYEIKNHAFAKYNLLQYSCDHCVFNNNTKRCKKSHTVYFDNNNKPSLILECSDLKINSRFKKDNI